MSFLRLPTWTLLTAAPSDPFVHMARNNKTYGFTIAVKELRETVPNLFRYASAYKRSKNITSTGLWSMFTEPKKVEDKPSENLPEDVLKMEPGRGKIPEVDPTAMEGEDYNMCHFWSNFEIARLDFFRSKAYEDFFNMVDKSGGFWSERVCVGELNLFAAVANVCIVGRCACPLARNRHPSWTRRYPLLPGYRLPSHHDPALPGERTGKAARERAVD